MDTVRGGRPTYDHEQLLKTRYSRPNTHTRFLVIVDPTSVETLFSMILLPGVGGASARDAVDRPRGERRLEGHVGGSGEELNIETRHRRSAAVAASTGGAGHCVRTSLES